MHVIQLTMNEQTASMRLELDDRDDKEVLLSPRYCPTHALAK